MPANDSRNLRRLSLRARIAIALHLFRGYCNRHSLDDPEIDRFLEHLWEFIALPVDGSEFEPWRKREPPLTYVGLGDDSPSDFDSVLRMAGVSAGEFRQVLAFTTEVLYSSMYAAADEEGSRRYLSELARVAESIAAEWPDMTCFAGSKWTDGHGWGKPPSEQELAEWRQACDG